MSCALISLFDHWKDKYNVPLLRRILDQLLWGDCNCSMFCCTLLYVHSSIAIILMGKRELVTLLSLSSWCLVMVERLFLAVPWGCLRFVIVVIPDHTHLLFLIVTSGDLFFLVYRKCTLF